MKTFSDAFTFAKVGTTIVATNDPIVAVFEITKLGLQFTETGSTVDTKWFAYPDHAGIALAAARFNRMLGVTHQIMNDGLVHDNYGSLIEAEQALALMLKDAERSAQVLRDEADELVANVMNMSIKERKA